MSRADALRKVRTCADCRASCWPPPGCPRCGQQSSCWPLHSVGEPGFMARLWKPALRLQRPTDRDVPLHRMTRNRASHANADHSAATPCQSCQHTDCPQRCTVRECTMLAPPFDLRGPRGAIAPFVLSSPHSGRAYPRHFLKASRLDSHTLRKSEDCYVEELMADVPHFGAPLLSARFPRAYCDVNREPFELDPRLFHEPLPSYANVRSARVVGGLGTIARVVAEAEPIYRVAPTLDDALQRIERLHFPYHATLRRLSDAATEVHGFSVVVDCHSMPSYNLSEWGERSTQIILGDRFGASCAGFVTSAFAQAFSEHGFSVSLNRPYAGGFITEHYGKPSVGRHAIQIEISREVYMDERTLERLPTFAAVRDRLTSAMARAFDDVMRLAGPSTGGLMAAE